MSEDLDDFDGLLNWARLGPWLDANLAVGDGPVREVVQLSGGSQNNLFRIHRDGGDAVLRRPPRFPRANSNDTMLREARVLRALQATGVPHPILYNVCDDIEVIGTCFYVMQPVDGFNPRSGLPGRYATDPEWRRGMAFELVRGAAALAAVDPAQVGLGGFGRPDGWLERQVERWRNQLESYKKIEAYGQPQLVAVDEVATWLERNRPSGFTVGIIHGDLQWANSMFAHHEPRLVALVDWELSTLGDPLLDLGLILTSWIEDGDPPGHLVQVEPSDGFPSRGELVAHYLDLTGRDPDLVPWYFVLACYKLGILLEGTYARSLVGEAPTDVGQLLHSQAMWYLAKANQLIGS